MNTNIAKIKLNLAADLELGWLACLSLASFFLTFRRGSKDRSSDGEVREQVLRDQPQARALRFRRHRLRLGLLYHHVNHRSP